MYTEQMQQVLATHEAFVGSISKQELEELMLEFNHSDSYVCEDDFYHPSLEEMDFDEYIAYAYMNYDIFSSYGNRERKSINLKETGKKEDLSQGLFLYV